ncbi:MAG: molybdate ABC transporter substrate-binding protein [Gammaproteobacteria bacterium]|nr:molybdate ABC transporter substrate-binding protein [Gammaproteobacteria bacterium]
MRRLILTLLLLATPLAHADRVKIAVAANFTAAMKELSALFHESTGYTAVVSYGSTGKLYAQILNGAPFQVFLAADRERPSMLHAAGLGDSPYTYAIGRLALWSPDPSLVDDRGEVLQRNDFARLAIANPKTAPYGAGAIQVLRKLGVETQTRSKMVRGDNIAQTYQFVMTGNVPLGFVAVSQVATNAQGSVWVPPQSLYPPIRQDAILLERGRDTPAAVSFVRFLQTDAARAVIRRHGYATG